MVRPIIFFIFVFVLLGIVYIKPQEGFLNWTSKNAGTPDSLNNKGTVPILPVAQLGVGSIEPGPPPVSDIPTAPAGLNSKESPNPYRNPTNEPAKYIRILAVKEELQAFFGFQAQSLENTSDPSIQIPLTRARADLSELIDIQSVMERNPGLASRVNNKQLDDIKSNVNYLQKSLSDIQANGPLKEGFKGSSNSSKTSNSSGQRASIRELQEFQIKLVVELKRLGASGTSDPLTKSRISNLTIIKKEIDDVITKIEKGFYKKDTVPIFKSDIQKSLPLLGNLNKPLPQLLNSYKLPPAIASLFPGGLSPKDKEQAAQINNIVKGYMKQLAGGVSWGVDVNVRYDNPNTLAAHPNYKPKGSYTMASGIPGLKPSASLKVSGTRTKKSKPNTKAPLDYKTNSTCTQGLPGSSNFRTFPDVTSGHLDWKKRSSQIISQIKKRGLRPEQFGAMPSNTEVGKDFSWRGYTRMICSRLNATTDPGLSVTVGCPEENWNGWRQ